MTRELDEEQIRDAEMLLENLPDTIPSMETDDDVREAVRTLEEHARYLRRVIGMETTVIEGPRSLPVPRSWVEIEALITPIGMTAWAMFNGYARAANAEHVTAHTLFMQKAASVALALREEFDPSAFPPPDETDFARAWATVLDGEIIKPDYTDEERELVEHPFAEGEEE